MAVLNESYIEINGTDIQNGSIGVDSAKLFQDLNPGAMEVFWMLGLTTSALCLILQIFIYILIPSSRKVDQKILTQLTVARFLNSLFEYFVLHSNLDYSIILKDAVFAIYQHSDAALICWMFVFTKNLYDKVIIVFNTKPNFVLISVAVWILTLPIGIFCPYFIKRDMYDVYYNIYAIVKFLVLLVNLVLFCRIFWIAVVRKSEKHDDGKGFLRTFAVGFILVTITSLQVFLTDLTSFAFHMYPDSILVFCVVNCYEAVVITALFVILVGGVSEGSIFKLIKKRMNYYFLSSFKSEEILK